MHGRLKEIYELKTFVPDRNSNKYLFFKFIFMNHVFFSFVRWNPRKIKLVGFFWQHISNSFSWIMYFFYCALKAISRKTGVGFNRIRMKLLRWVGVTQAGKSPQTDEHMIGWWVCVKRSTSNTSHILRDTQSSSAFIFICIVLLCL